MIEASTDEPGTEDVLEGVPRTMIITGKVYSIPVASSAVTVTVTVVPAAAIGAITLRISSFVPETLVHGISVSTITSVALLRYETRSKAKAWPAITVKGPAEG